LSVCFKNISSFVLKLDPNRSKYTFLHSILDKGLENINALNDSINLLTGSQDNEWVYWKEGYYHSKKELGSDLQVSLHASKIDISEVLRRKLYDKNVNFILTSATIKVENSFDYFLHRNGLEDSANIVTREYISPFSYHDQVKYYQYGGSRDITNDIGQLADLIYHVHTTYKKRTMVLFTSIKMLENVSKKIKERLGGNKIPLFAQSRGASKPSIIKGMHSNDNALLFGTNSFWEGVDLPGELLEILIVVKLPFDVPSDPLIKSYSHQLDKNGYNSFMNFAIPECATRFRQGFGRLIRTTFDSGVFISLDNRIVTKRYGDVLLNSIPTDPEIFTDYHSIK
jgi:Rad3-related DNA helicase